MVWNSLKLDEDAEYLKMQEEYHKKLAQISQKLNVSSSYNFESKKCHFVAMIRHAERADSVKDKNKKRVMEFKNKVDPQLSPKGIEQAKATGRYLKKYFEDNQMTFDHFVIESSPFLRTLQTAAWIASELGSACKQIHVNYLLTDLLYEK